MIDEQTKPRGTFWWEFPILLAVAIVVTVVVRTFVMQTFFIPSESMQHTLNIDDRVLVNKLVYDFRPPRRGEIIVFKAPELWRADPVEKDFIKRVIGIGGDHVVCCDSKQRIMVNGKPLDESYVFHDKNGVADLASEDAFDITVPAGRLWVMGDHRSQSGDSRQQYLRSHDVRESTIPEKTVVGKAFVLFWPLGRATWLDVPSTFDKVPAPPKT